MLLALFKGFSASGSLIIAIGAQNAFVIRQGLRLQHLLLTALACSLIDALLILLGVAALFCSWGYKRLVCLVLCFNLRSAFFSSAFPEEELLENY